MNRLRRVRHDQSGMSYVFIGMGMMAFLSATMLAIDVGMLMTSRSQAQNSADAGALAGATALVFNNYTDRTTGGPAVTGARNAAQANKVMGTGVSVQPSDVTFPPNPSSGLFNRVKVDVFRTTARGNPVSTLIARVLRNPDRRHRRHCDCRGLPVECDDLRQTVHDPGQMDREADPGLGHERHLRNLRQAWATRWRTRTSMFRPANRDTPATA